MSTFKFLLFSCLILIYQGFSPTISHGSNSRNYHRSQVKMGNNAKFGIFSPAVYAARFVLGEAKLNKVSFLLNFITISIIS